MIEVGQKVKFDPTREHKGFVPKKGAKDEKPKKVTGVVVYVNEQNKWVSAEYNTASGEKLRTAFKFWDIGKTVTVCNGK